MILNSECVHTFKTSSARQESLQRRLERIGWASMGVSNISPDKDLLVSLHPNIIYSLWNGTWYTFSGREGSRSCA